MVEPEFVSITTEINHTWLVLLPNMQQKNVWMCLKSECVYCKFQFGNYGLANNLLLVVNKPRTILFVGIYVPILGTIHWGCLILEAWHALMKIQDFMVRSKFSKGKSWDESGAFTGSAA